MFLRYSSDLLGCENEVVVPLSFQTQDCSVRKVFPRKGRPTGGRGGNPSLSRISCLTAVLPLEPALEVALLGLNFFLSQRIVITGSVEVDDVTLARILKNRTFPTQSPLLDRRELYVAVAPLGRNIFADYVSVAAADAMLEPIAAAKNKIDKTVFMVFISLTSFRAFRWPSSHVTSPRGKNSLRKKYCCWEFFAPMRSFNDMDNVLDIRAEEALAALISTGYCCSR